MQERALGRSWFIELKAKLVTCNYFLVNFFFIIYTTHTRSLLHRSLHRPSHLSFELLHVITKQFGGINVGR